MSPSIKKQKKDRNCTTIVVYNSKGEAPRKRRAYQRNKPASASKHKKSVISKVNKIEPSDTNEMVFKRLAAQLDYFHDSLATINVIFDSLRHTYVNCKGSIDQLKNETRLSDMEKELLTAYDDLSLQAVHLEKDIAKMERRISELRSLSFQIPQGTPLLSTAAAFWDAYPSTASDACSSTTSDTSSSPSSICIFDELANISIFTKRDDDIYPIWGS